MSAGPRKQGIARAGGGGRSLAPVGESEGYTGIIIDCRGFGLKRTMSPLLRVSDNPSVKWGEDSTHDQIIRVGIAAYYRSLDGARQGRAGKRPIVIKALGVTGPFEAYPIVAPRDVARIKRVDKAWDTLDRCQVAFIQ